MASRMGGDRESPAKERTVNSSGFLEKLLLISLSANPIRYCIAAAQARGLYEAVMECNEVPGAGAERFRWLTHNIVERDHRSNLQMSDTLLDAQFDGIFGNRQERLKSEDCT